jgi:hypothetical protein
MVDKPVLGSVTWPHFIFRFLKTFYECASRNKIRVSTNFVIFGPTDQKLWVFEVFRRSLGRAGMCCSQWGRVDHMCKKGGQEEEFFFAQGGVRAPGHSRPQSPIFWIFWIFEIFFGGLENGLGLLEEWMYNTPIFWSLPLYLEVLNLPFLMELGDFIFLKFYFFLN